VWQDGTRLADLPSLGDVSSSEWPIADLDVRRKDSQWSVATLQTNSVEGHLTLRPNEMRSKSAGAQIRAVFVNDTSFYVDVIWIDAEGNEHAYAAGLAPGAQHDQSSFAGHVWIVRAAFSAELLDMFVLDAEPSQTIAIHDTFRRRSATLRPLPSPIGGVDNVALVGQLRERPRPESRDYIVISEHDNRERPGFNTRSNVVPRTIRISGVKLIWDTLDDRYGLMAYQGSGVLDLAALELFADHIVIGSPLRFPGTKVTIHARELEFRGDGSIDTTPIAQQAPARASRRTKDAQGKDHPADYQAADGLPGEPGGDVDLFIRTLTLPKGSEARPRIITRGAAGQAGEPGGRRGYAPTSDQQPLAADGKDLAPITAGAIRQSIQSAGFPSANDAHHWRWPGEVDWPDQIRWNDRQLFFNEGGSVVDLVVVAHDDAWGGTDTNVFLFPNPERRNFVRVWDNAPIERVSDIGVSPRNCRPGDGENAYAGGQPGDGGAAGQITSSLPTSLLEPLCDSQGGAAGPTTPPEAGGERGGPVPAYRVQIDIVKKTPPWESGRSPQLWVEQVESADGHSEPERSASAGMARTLQHQPRSWLQPEVVDAVLTCARDAYRNGHRDMAQALLDPYYAALRSGDADEELSSRFVAIQSMRTNLLNNLDYYGNPAGWLPRLRLSTNFDVFQRVRQLSTSLLYYGLTTEQKYDSLEHQDELARQASDVLGQELDFAVTSLRDACTDLAQARLELEDASRRVLAKQADLNLLKSLTEQEALEATERQRLYRGICKTIGGVMKTVPVGQPYLGLAGDVAGIAGDIDFTNPDALPKQVAGALTKVGATTDKFLQNNTDLLVEDRVRGLRGKLKLDQANMDDLGEQLARTKSATANVERAIATDSKEIQSQWTNERAAQLKKLNKTLSDTNAEIELFSAKEGLTPAEEQQQQAAREAAERLKQRLGQVGASSLTRERARVTREIEALKDEIAKEEEQAKESAAEQNTERKQRLEQERQDLEQFKQKVDGLEEQQRAAKRRHTEDSEELKTQEKESKQTLARLKGMGAGLGMLGEGIATLATPATKDDPDVQALTRLLLKSTRRETYQKVLGEFETLGKSQAAAMAQVGGAQQALSTNVARIAENMTAQNGLSRQRQSLDGVLDIRTKRYLRGMQERARDMLRWSVYNLVMSYRYEFLRDVSDSFFNFDKMVDALRELEAAPATPQSGPPKPLAQARFKEIDDTVLLNELLGEARAILEEREHRAGAAYSNQAVCQLTDEQLEQLRVTGQVTFNLVRDLQAGSLDWVDARIVDLNLTELGLDTGVPALSLRATFRHSGESVLLGRDDRTRQWTYYYFRAAPGDDPIEWGFSYNRALVEASRIKKDQKEKERDDLLNRALEGQIPGGPPKIDYKEYSPSYFSDITLYLTRGKAWDPGAISRISSVKFNVTYALTTERRH
jgi:hypothetical protein